MNWDSQRLAQQLGLAHPSIPAIKFQRILFDSRQYNGDSHQVFFAIQGANHNGHHFVESLYQKGLRIFVLQVIPEIQHRDAVYLKVPDSLKALQYLAQIMRQAIKPRIIAITGSNGKTIVKEWLYRMLANQSGVYRSPKSFNSQLGVPLSLWSMPEDTELGIFEAGISMPNEMASLAEILEPQAGIFTNIGSAHGANFEDRRQKVQEKLKLFKSAEFIIAPGDDEFLVKELKVFCSNYNLKLLAWSFSANKASAWAEVLERKANYCSFRLHRTHAGSDDFEIPFGDDASLQNAINALYMALELKAAPQDLRQLLQHLVPVEMRLEMKEGHQDTLLINDAYNSDLESLRIALHFLKEHGRDRKKVLILSELLQSGFEPEVLKHHLEDVIGPEKLERLIAIGPYFEKYPLELNTEIAYFKSTEAFLRAQMQFNWEHRAVLLKGSRSFRFERIDHQFARQRHETVMEIHLNRLVHNLNYYRSLLKEDTRLMVMVKAFAYGSGSEEIARVLAFHGVDYLAVAYADEGVALRRSGIQLPIMVLNPESAALDSFFDYNLEPEVYSFARFEEFSAMALRREMDLKIHLKLETGMNRLGFSAGDLTDLIARITSQSRLKVASVFSHLAASDDPAHTAFTQSQIESFKHMSARLKADLGHSFFRHLANTGAIESYPEAYFDMVRLGIGLYGVSPHPEKQNQLLAVGELKATVSQVKVVAKGDTVGYGRAWQAHEEQNIAIISIGYADGFSRSLGEGRGVVMIHGKSYPIIGRVCMDMCMIAVGADPVKEGDEVLIFGNDLPVQKMAEAMNTIPYEVLTGISSRVKRIYFMA